MKKTILIVSTLLLLASVCSYGQDPQKDMLDFADKLESCEVYTQKFIHPFTGESMERRIEGFVDGKCLYIEEMPNGGKMVCRYPEETLKAIAQSYRDLATANAETTSVHVRANFKTEEQSVKINGKDVVDGPLQEAMDNGTCKVLGYGEDRIPDNFKKAILRKYAEEIKRFKSEEEKIVIDPVDSNMSLEKLLPNWKFFHLLFSTQTSEGEGSYSFTTDVYNEHQFLAGVHKKTQRVLDLDGVVGKAFLSILKEESVRINNKDDALKFGGVLTIWGKNHITDVQLFNSNEWEIYTGTFFDYKSGYLVKVGTSGKIEEIRSERKLRAVEREQNDTPSSVPSDTNEYQEQSSSSLYQKEKVHISKRVKKTKTWPNGNRYVGMCENGMMYGQGTMFYSNGDKYIGEWKYDKRDGQGIYTGADGTKYEGQWKDDQRHGLGTHAWVEGTRYVGMWERNKQHGQGTYTYPDGAKYVGEWKYDMADGFGILIWADGSKYVGEWKGDKRDGQGTYTGTDGIKYKGRWEGDKFVE